MMNLDYITLSRYLKIHDWAKKKNIDTTESFFPNQITAKLWMIEELFKLKILTDSIKVEIVGSWYGWPLAEFLFKNFDIKSINMYDIDVDACKVAHMYSRIFKVENKVKIINNNYWKVTNKSNSDLIINCSSEHMIETFDKFKHRYPLSPIFVVQSNNLIEEDTHINCCRNVDELIQKNKFKTIYYKGELDFNDLNENGKYKRFMVIGKI